MANPSGQEVELKLRFDDAEVARELQRLLDPTCAVEPVEQTNHFFDTPGRVLRAAGIGLRLRRERSSGGERWVVTAKARPGGQRPVPPEERGPASSLSHRAEEEAEVDAGTAQAILEEKENPLDALCSALGTEPELAGWVRAALQGTRPPRAGQFTNVRRPLPWALSVGGQQLTLLVELDRTEFCDRNGAVVGVHHEAEVELAHPEEAALVEPAFRALIESAGGEPFASRGKAARFFEALDSSGAVP